MPSLDSRSNVFTSCCVALNHSCRVAPFLVISALSMLSCTDDSLITPSLASIIISPSSVTLDALGDTTRFEAEVRDADGNTMAGVSVTWNSSSPTVATVNVEGLATAQGLDEASIIASASGMGDTALVVASAAVVAEIAAQGVPRPCRLQLRSLSTLDSSNRN